MEGFGCLCCQVSSLVYCFNTIARTKTKWILSWTSRERKNLPMKVEYAQIFDLLYKQLSLVATSTLNDIQKEILDVRSNSDKVLIEAMVEAIQ